MALFQKKSPDLSAKRAALVARLQASEAKLAELRQAAVTAARNGTAVDAAAAWQTQFEVDAAHAALAEIDREIEQAAEKARVAADEALRKETSRALNAAADKLEQAFAPLPEALRAGHAAYLELEYLLGSSGLPDLLQNLAVELPNALAFHVAGLRARAAQTLEGTAPAQLPKPFIPEIVPSEARPPEIQVFALKNLLWKDHHGQSQQCGMFQIHALPVKAAKIALERRVALEADSAEAKAIYQNKAGLPHVHNPEAVIDLDRPLGTVSIYSSGGKKLRDVPPQPFANIREHEPVKTVWVDRLPEPTPGGSDPNDVL